MGEAWATGLKSLAGHKQSATTIKTLWPAWTATSSKDRWIGAYSIGLTNLGKFSCPIKKKQSKVSFYQMAGPQYYQKKVCRMAYITFYSSNNHLVLRARVCHWQPLYPSLIFAGKMFTWEHNKVSLPKVPNWAHPRELNEGSLPKRAYQREHTQGSLSNWAHPSGFT